MPDSIAEYMQQCTQFGRQTAHVGDYIQYNLATPSRPAWPRCTCPVNVTAENGWTEYEETEVPEFCEHIERALRDRCVWLELYGAVQTEEQRRNHVCPLCGASTINVKLPSEFFEVVKHLK